jgi:GNAT superfamily N-acetyltransferase
VTAIREARDDELHVVLALMRAAFAESAREAHPSSALREMLDDVRAVTSRGGAILAFDRDRPIGSARFIVSREEGYLSYERLAVHPAGRGHGHGAAMIDWLEDHARALGLSEVRADARSQMPDNRPFYLARGYEIIGYADRYGVTGLRTRMRKRLRT